MENFSQSQEPPKLTGFREKLRFSIGSVFLEMPKIHHI